MEFCSKRDRSEPTLEGPTVSPKIWPGGLFKMWDPLKSNLGDSVEKCVPAPVLSKQSERQNSRLSLEECCFMTDLPSCNDNITEG